ncbi:hypothetical protein PQE74_gp222 [Bacillus phage vB_BanS_Chewbecca]|uniref:Uncharacterized protein n=3 Tax=Tsamsavirus TaxID=3044849 RepID=A0AAE8YW87_9CAUD|nr:hypothetical protein PQE72_gp013 [Bacillus phage vB_BanS_Skywalker]YP_010681131.1 hypothetical protein PQE73_gp232 [Bacillus phage vB_BanS_MrDarsey]YP_010681368.1 hypothetical protein PQE74_gp222 [Bacillus phage vB_BanS_Chewbecca]UGO46308.1 hypothetical protein CHEWBECCA_245 [Bacillus phage vB_BanS_Chewbecca]UGO48067.1 hypothetical protein MRDARSEY_255 [Bacillus phage vB_BanS_MrDarsey]UGO51191.1 hypothetical protein SKYWALKER_13 [Bacillus phage vB_BanS_Skywalker]
MRTEEEVDTMIAEMTNRTKGNYITQGVSFNKTCPRQMALLKKALMLSVSFSGLAKETLAMRFNDSSPSYASSQPSMSQNITKKETKSKDIGNFL